VIKRVVYQIGYRDTSGVDFLVKAGVVVEQIEVLG
jgi:dCMP deaminase